MRYEKFLFILVIIIMVVVAFFIITNRPTPQKRTEPTEKNFVECNIRSCGLIGLKHRAVDSDDEGSNPFGSAIGANVPRLANEFPKLVGWVRFLPHLQILQRGLYANIKKMHYNRKK